MSGRNWGTGPFLPHPYPKLMLFVSSLWIFLVDLNHKSQAPKHHAPHLQENIDKIWTTMLWQKTQNAGPEVGGKRETTHGHPEGLQNWHETWKMVVQRHYIEVGFGGSKNLLRCLYISLNIQIPAEKVFEIGCWGPNIFSDVWMSRVILLTIFSLFEDKKPIFSGYVSVLVLGRVTIRNKNSTRLKQARHSTTECSNFDTSDAWVFLY